MKKGLQAYKKVSAQVQVEEATPHQLIQMMYEAAIESIKLAKAAIEDKNVLLKIEKINKAFNLVESLKCCLDMDQDPDLAQNLDKLYEFMLTQLVLINANNDTELCDRLCGLLGELLEAWRQIPAHQHQLTSVNESSTPAPATSSNPKDPPPK
jgi:flagellar protein FliS